MSIDREKVLQILVEICETEEVRANPDLQLYELGVLDSFGTVQLLVALEEQLDIALPITEVDRDCWATPNKIIHYLEERF